MWQITTSRADKLEGIPIGELSRRTGVNIETIRYYEKIKMFQSPRRTEPAYSPLSVAHVSLVSLLTKYAPCSTSGGQDMQHAPMFGRLPWVTLTTSAPKSPI